MARFSEIVYKHLKVIEKLSEMRSKQYFLEMRPKCYKHHKRHKTIARLPGIGFEQEYRL